MSPHAAVLAASDTGKGSPIGLFVILLLLVAVYLLYRSMSGRLRRLPERFPGYGAAGTDGAGADGLTTAAAASPDTAGTTGADPDTPAGAGPDGDPAGNPGDKHR
jgi:hypothetical protein